MSKSKLPKYYLNVTMGGRSGGKTLALKQLIEQNKNSIQMKKVNKNVEI